jgi:transglutaminase-like putative cysteine protease
MKSASNSSVTSASINYEPTGASLAFTSNDPIVVRARDLLNSGKFTEAEALLATADNEPGDLRARAETIDIIRRIRHNYSLTAAELLDKIRASIPDAAASEVDRWAVDCEIRWRLIDGRKFFFRREPRNIFLLSEEARRRREQAGNTPTPSSWKLIDHLQAVVDESSQTGRAEAQPVHHKVTHTLTIPGNTPGMKVGSLVRVWLPFPQEYRQQRDVKLISATPEPRLIAPNGGGESAVAGSAHRTVYFERFVTDPAKPVAFKLSYTYTSFAWHPQLEEAGARPLPSDWNGAFLNERPPHIVFTPEIRRQVAAILGTETNQVAQARQLFRWVCTHLRWNAEDEYSTIPSFSLKGFHAGHGDCGVLSTVFITLCRIAGIPARWQSGFATLPGNTGGGGMHDWSEIYLAPWGWVPVDVSPGTYGLQKSNDPRLAEFYCGHLDSYRMIVNLDWGRELFPPKQSLRSEPADFQRGEVEIDGWNLYFDQWDYQMEFEKSAVAVSLKTIP